MASLMPLQKSVTPWKVGSGSTLPSGRGWTQVGNGGVPVLIPEERGRGCARAPRAPGFPTRSGRPFQAREVGTRSSRWNLSQAGRGPRSVTGRVLAGREGLVRLCPPLTQPLCQAPPQIRPFHQDDFLRSLDHAGPQLTCILKGDWLGLYRWVDSRQGPEALAAGGCRKPVPTAWLMGSALQPLPLVTHRRFFKSPHFDGWYRQRRKEMVHKLEALHLEAVCEAVRGWGVVTGPALGRGPR